MIASFQKKWENFHVPVRTGILSQFISDRNNKKRNGRAGPELGGPLKQAHEQLALTCTAGTGERHHQCWVIRAWQTDTLTAYLDSAHPLPAMGLQGPRQGTAFLKVEMVPTPKCSKPSTTQSLSSLEGSRLVWGIFWVCPEELTDPRAPAMGRNVAAIKYTENGSYGEDSSLFGSQLSLWDLASEERRCYLEAIWTFSQVLARKNLSTCSPLAATFPPLSPSSSRWPHIVINIAVPEHLCALPPASEALSLCLLTSTHLPPLAVWPNTTCGFLVVSTIHLGTPKGWIMVLNASLKSRPNSFLRSKLSFHLAHHDPLFGNLLSSIKANRMR